jgi:SAM-dependent methyltransferase
LLVLCTPRHLLNYGETTDDQRGNSNTDDAGDNNTMYELLVDIATRPQPFSRYTAKELWTSPHVAQQMLDFHLDQDTDLASRSIEQIDQAVAWIESRVGFAGKSVCDLGCGPGLYAQRFSAQGARVVGVDFSAHSLDYARAQSGDEITYVEADYLLDDLPLGFDLVTLIYTDLCVLSPAQRHTLLSRMWQMLNPGGQIVIDVVGMAGFTDKQESIVIEQQMMHGFWSAGDYVGVLQSLVYEDEALTLDRYLIAEPHRTWQIFNWFQHFTIEGVTAELLAAGFEVREMAGALSGEPLRADSELMAIIADRK